MSWCSYLTDYCFEGWIIPSKISCSPHVGPWLPGNLSIYLSCWAVFLNVGTDRWLSSSSDREWEIWGTATLEVCIPWWPTWGCKWGMDGDRSWFWNWWVAVTQLAFPVYNFDRNWNLFDTEHCSEPEPNIPNLNIKFRFVFTTCLNRTPGAGSGLGPRPPNPNRTEPRPV